MANMTSALEEIFGKQPEVEVRRPRVVQTFGEFHIAIQEGEYSLFHNGRKILGPTDETSVNNRLKYLTSKRTEVVIETKPQVEAEIENVIHPCPNCGIPVSSERKELLGVVTCPACTPQAEKLYGIMEYGAKAGGVLVVGSRKLIDTLKKPANRRR